MVVVGRVAYNQRKRVLLDKLACHSIPNVICSVSKAHLVRRMRYSGRICAKRSKHCRKTKLLTVKRTRKGTTCFANGTAYLLFLSKRRESCKIFLFSRDKQRRTLQKQRELLQTLNIVRKSEHADIKRRTLYKLIRVRESTTREENVSRETFYNTEVVGNPCTFLRTTALKTEKQRVFVLKSRLFHVKQQKCT